MERKLKGQKLVEQYYNFCQLFLLQMPFLFCYQTYNSIAVQMSELSLSVSQASQITEKAPKTKEQYSRNVKKLKLKLKNVQQQIADFEKKISAYTNTSNDKMIALKISKFCRERRLTPEMIFRFADKKNQGKITKEQFKEVLTTLGIKLTKHQMARLQYLLDQDISGDISKFQYYGYLHAYGIKGEYSADDPFLKDALNKFDLDKIKLIADEKKRENPDSKKHRQLLNYEQFLKYCHRHLPELSDKEIASIFNRLERDGLIDLEDFIAYLKKREEENRKMKEKNKIKEKGKKDASQPADETKTLKGLIKALLKNRPKDSKSLFHSSQFQRLQKLLDRSRGELMMLYRQIDKKKKGSFGFSELVQYYVERQSSDNLLFAYELMGRKITLNKEKPEDVINQYNKGDKIISISEFIKFTSSQFEMKEGDSKKIFQVLAKKESKIPVRMIIDAMKLEEGQKKIVYIKPSLWGAEGKDFFKKNCITILFNPFVALRFCISIMEQMQKSKVQLWDDFEFGPTFEDPYGTYSINMDIPTEDIKWLSTSSLGMNDFYIPINGKKYLSTAISSHEMLLKSLSLLVEESEALLWNKNNLERKSKVEEDDLKPLFEGIYPRVFHSFAKYGMYVFRFFVREQWVYVLIDNKIPCNSDNEPIFSTSIDKKTCWISLIEKAYAKVKGSYKNSFLFDSKQYLFQLSRKIPLENIFQQEFKEEETKNKLWKHISHLSEKKEQIYSITENTENLFYGNIETGIIKHMPYRIEDTVQIEDQKCSNSHKSHRLVLIKGRKNIKNEQKWNTNWHQGQGKNKFDEFDTQIDAFLKKKKSKVQILKENNIKIINFKVFRKVFDRIFYMRNVSFQNMIILRKVIQFQQKFTCKYDLSSTEETTMMISLNQLKSPEKTIIKITLKDKKNSQVVHLTEKITEKFGAIQLKLKKELCTLEMGVENWHSDNDHAYLLTFYFESPRFHLKELDRHLLFHQVSPYEEGKKLDINKCQDKERTFIYRNFYSTAERTRGCCG